MAAAPHNFVCRNCGGTKAKDSGDGMLHCTTCGMQTPAESAARHSPHTPPATPSATPPAAPPRNTGLGWRRLLYIPMLFSLGLSGYYVVQAYRSGNLSKQIPNIFNPNGENYHWSGSDHGVYVGKKGSPGLFIIGERRLNTGRAVAPGNGPHLIFFSLPDYAEVNSQKLKLSQLKEVGNRFEVLSAGNGVFYVLLNEERLLRVNSADFSLKDVTATLLAHPELAGDTPKIEVLSGVQTAAFEVKTKAGRKFCYDPAANRIHAALEDAVPQTATAAIPDTAVGFAFSRRSAIFPDAPIQLIRYVAAKSGSSINPLPYFSWQRAAETASFQKETQPVLRATGAVRHFEDFNPGRPYYKARVLYWDKDLVLIASAKLPQKDALQMLQSLDANTGEVRFTLPLPSADYPTDVVRYQEGFLVKDVASVFVVSNSGVLIKELKIQ